MRADCSMNSDHAGVVAVALQTQQLLRQRVHRQLHLVEVHPVDAAGPSSRVKAPISRKKLKRVMFARPWALEAPKRTERKIPAMNVA